MTKRVYQKPTSKVYQIPVMKLLVGSNGGSGGNGGIVQCPNIQSQIL